MELNDLIDLLKTSNDVILIDRYKFDISRLFPIITIMFDFNQRNHAHQYDLWFHSLYTVLGLPRNLEDDMLYLSALFHDIGKPKAQCHGKNKDDTSMHYYGHPEISYDICQEYIVPILKSNGVFDTDYNRFLYYVRYHDDMVSLKLKHTRRHLKLVDIEDFRKLMLLEIADAKAHIIEPVIQRRIDICQKLYDYGIYENYQRILNGE